MTESSKPTVPAAAELPAAPAAALDASADPRLTLLQKCWALAEDGVLAQSPRIFQEVQLGIARSGGADAGRLARDFSLQQTALVGAWRNAVRAGHGRALAVFLGQRKAPPAAAVGSGLSLMGMDETDISGTVDQATARLRDLVQGPWNDVYRRLQTLAGRPLADSELALHPGLFLQAAADGLGLSGEAQAAVVRQLPAAMASALAAAYLAMDRLLEAAGIEPQAVVRAAPVLRASGPPTIQRHVPPTIRRDAAGRLEEPLLGLEIEVQSAPARRAPRTDAIPEQEIPELQPDPWGLREYVRLQAQHGVNASVLFEAAMQRLHDGPAPDGIVRDAPSRPLVSAMIAAQKLDVELVARIAVVAEDSAPGATPAAGNKVSQEAPQDEPTSTREYSRRLIGLAALPVHKHTVHLVSRVFARIERDRVMPEAVRSMIVALRFPFMELALADPSVLVRPDHPARGFINTLATASIEQTGSGTGSRRFLQQARAVVQFVLSAPGSAASAFPQALEQVTAFLAEQAQAAASGPMGAARDALRAAEEREARALEVGEFLSELLAGAPLDPVLRRFLQRDWARVLVEAADAEAGASSSAPAGHLRRMLGVVPELVWSAQPVHGPQDRKRFVEVVPVLLESLRDGVARIGWSGSRLREFVEHLKQVHANALTEGEGAPGGSPAFSVSTVRIRLDGFRMDDLELTPRLKPFEVVEEAVHRFLEGQDSGIAHRRVPALKPPEVPVTDAARAEQIVERWRAGAWFDLRIARSALRVRLEAFTPSRSLALFSVLPDAGLISLSHASLVSCVRHAWMAPVESLPLVARAFRIVTADLRGAAQAAAEGDGRAG